MRDKIAVDTIIAAPWTPQGGLWGTVGAVARDFALESRLLGPKCYDIVLGQPVSPEKGPSSFPQ